MSDSIPLNWAIMAVSFFNTILLFWLGITVLVNAERRDWGIWLASSGLLTGSAFFVSHTAIQGLFIGGHVVSGYTAIISEGLLSIGRSMIFWWTIGLVPAIILPFAWYVIMLWYGGFWRDRHSSLYRRQRLWFWLTVALLILGVVGLATGIILLAIPSQALLGLRLFIRWSIAGIPLMSVAYSGYVVLCIALALDAVRRPGPSDRVMGNQARQRARPWLAAASIALLAVSLLVSGILLWTVQETQHLMLHEFYARSAGVLALFDLIVAFIISLVILLLGQALVSYEVFTGKTLPRRGLQRHWQRAVLLASGYSLVVGGTIAIALRPLYSLLLTTIIMTLFLALSSWRSYAERERYIKSLRPFISSHHLYDQILMPSAPTDVEIGDSFRFLCANVLDTKMAYLSAVGPLAALVSPLAYGSETAGIPALASLLGQFTSPEITSVPLVPEQFGGAIWGISLWSERGLIGVFLLGERRDGGLYTQEEIEIARVSGERLIDTRASAEMGRRLMGLQRERLAQSQVIDQHTRRTLHDDILPSLHTAMLALSDQASTEDSAISLLADAHRQISDLLHEMPTVTSPEVTRLGLVDALHRTVQNDLAPAFDVVSWEIAPNVSSHVERIPSLTAEVIFYAAREAIRNAARHGRDATSDRPFTLRVSMEWLHGLQMVIEDNGVGLGDGSNRNGGQGLALHNTMMAVIGGTLSAESVPGQFTRVSLCLPLNE
jgi:signal transduction histidine kinase